MEKKDLKGKAPAKLRWQLEKQIALDPFLSPGGQSNAATATGSQDNNWQTGEYIDVKR